MDSDPSHLSPAGPVSGLRQAYGFATFNALSFQIILGSPMILYAKSLEAGATVLGVIAGMMPLLVIFQIPAANYIPRFGYRRFVLSGWSLRVLFIFLMAWVPLTAGFLPPMGRLALLLFLLFGFNLSRGISSAAWLPWITSLVPPERRGHYLARDSACVNAASAATLLLSAAVLQYRPAPWQFAAIFSFSALMGAVSLRFLRNMPDVPCAEAPRSSGAPVPWREIGRYAPFRKLLRMNIGWSIAYGGMSAFTVAYLKAAGMSSGWILVTTAAAYVGGLGGLALFGSRLDRHGSRPVLVLCLSGWVLLLAAWTVLSGGLLSSRLGFVLLIQGLMGLGFSVYSMANTRLAMVLIPTMGRSHFFALFSVIGNLSLGIAPILWGLLIDAVGTHRWSWGAFELNRYSLFFLLATGAFVFTWILCRRLHDPSAGRTEELLADLLQSRPVGSWMRFWPRG